jgi:hypothetical protein
MIFKTGERLRIGNKKLLLISLSNFEQKVHVAIPIVRVVQLALPGGQRECNDCRPCQMGLPGAKAGNG